MIEKSKRLDRIRGDLEYYRLALARFEREVDRGELGGANPTLIEREWLRLANLIESFSVEVVAVEKELASIADLTEAQQEAYGEYRNRHLLPAGLARLAATGIKIIFLVPGKKTVINPDGDDATMVVINNSGVKLEDWVD